MDLHWKKHLLPGIKSLLEEDSCLRDLIFICQDGDFHSFGVLFKGIPELHSVPGPRVVLLPDVSLKEMMVLHKGLLCPLSGENVVPMESLSLLRLLGFNHSSKGEEMERKGTKRKRIRVPTFKNKCQICHKIFSSSQALRNHQGAHAQKKPFQCPTCSKGFISEANLSAHSKKLHLEPSKPFPCSHCPSQFHSKCHLNRHIRSLHFEHSDKRSFLCQDCGKSFVDPSALSAHQKIHSNVRSHVCPECQKHFLTPAQLRIHLRTHTGERPYVCPGCGKGFVTSSQLKSHASHKHHPSDEILYEDSSGRISDDEVDKSRDNKGQLCQFCNEYFRDLVALCSHGKNCSHRIKAESRILKPILLEASQEEVVLSDEGNAVVERSYSVDEPIDLWLSS